MTVTEMEKAERRAKAVRSIRRSSELEGSRSTAAIRADQDDCARGAITAAELGDRVRRATTFTNRAASAAPLGHRRSRPQLAGLLRGQPLQVMDFAGDVVHGLADAAWGTKRFVAFLDADAPHVAGPDVDSRPGFANLVMARESRSELGTTRGDRLLIVGDFEVLHREGRPHEPSAD